MKIPSGTDVIDKLLNGGYDKGIITTIYGPAGSGKTTLCLLASIKVAENRKVIYIDTEGGFSVERLKQLSDKDVMKSIFVLKPVNFEDQSKKISNLTNMINDKIGLVVVDTISMLYRVEISRTKDPKPVYSEMDWQIGALSEIAKKNDIPVIVTNQVYSDFDDPSQVKMIGGDMLKYASKCLIELSKYKTYRKALIRKHRSIPENKEILFEIKERGLEER
ncbi:MAG: DNA repair and recombination protein RadB [Candidatus Woesearchaeota archaeon]